MYRLRTFLFFFHSLALLCWGCPYSAIPRSDIKDAVYTAKAAYTDGEIGEKIHGNGFIIKSRLKGTYKGKSLKAIIADKASTRVVALGVEWAPRHLANTIRQTMFKGKVIVQFGGKNTSVSPFLWGAVKILIPDVEPLIRNTSKKYIITGHSLGGAMATLLAVYMTGDRNSIWNNVESRLITFGEPRVGTNSFASIHDKLIHPRRKIRVNNGQDIITHIPSCLYGWRHASRELWMKTKFEWIVGAEKESLLRCVNTRYLLKKISDHFIDRYVEGVKTTARTFKRIQRQSYRYYRFKIVRIRKLPYKSLSAAMNSVCTE